MTLTAPAEPRHASGHRARVVDRALLALGAAAGLLLATYAGLGVLVRPLMDDFCFGALTRDDGLFGMLGYEWRTQNGRVVNDLLAGAVGTSPLVGDRVFPGLLLALALAAHTALLREVGRLVGVAAWRIVLPLAALCVAVEVVTIGNTFQSWLWDPGAISHTVPPMLCALLLAAVLRARRSPRLRPAVLAALLPGSVAIGLFNEIVPLILVATAAVVLVLHVRWAPRRGYPTAVAGLTALGGVVAFLVLLLAPGSRTRRTVAPRSPLDAAALGHNLAVTVAHLVRSWQLLLVVLVGAVLGWVLHERLEWPAAWRRVPTRWWIGAAVIEAVAAVVITELLLTYAYGENAGQRDRANGNFVVLVVLLLTGLGALAGTRLRGRLAGSPRQARLVTRVAGAALAVLSIATFATAAVSTDHLTGGLARRAAAWDAQNARLLNERLRTTHRLTYHPHPFGGLGDAFSTTAYSEFPYQCVQQYYQVRIKPPARWPAGASPPQP